MALRATISSIVFQANGTFAYSFPTVTGITPTAVSLGGGTLLTLSGQCLGYSPTYYTSVLVQGSTAVTPSDTAHWHNLGDSSLVFTTYGTGNDPTLNLDVTLTWSSGSSGSSTLSGQLSSVVPIIAGVTPVGIFGGPCTVTGTHLGTNASFYTSFAIDSVGVMPSSTWTFMSDTSITLPCLTTTLAPPTALDVILSWPGHVSTGTGMLHYLSPTFLSYSYYLSPGSFCRLTVEGTSLGDTPNNDYWTYADFGDWVTSSIVIPYQQNHLYIFVPLGLVRTDATIYLHWRDLPYGIMTGVTFSC